MVNRKCLRYFQNILLSQKESFRNVFEPLMKGLARKGYKMCIIGYFSFSFVAFRIDFWCSLFAIILRFNIFNSNYSKTLHGFMHTNSKHLIGMTSSAMLLWNNKISENPPNPSYISNSFLLPHWWSGNILLPISLDIIYNFLWI